MARPIHLRLDSSGTTACGKSLSRVTGTLTPARVTAHCCLALLAKSPSLATSAAPAVKPLECGATIAEGEPGTPTEIYLSLELERFMGLDYARIWDSSIKPKVGLTKFVAAPADSDIHASREELLVDVVTKWDTWRASLDEDQQRFSEDNAWEALGSSISAARDLLAKGGGQ